MELESDLTAGLANVSTFSGGAGRRALFRQLCRSTRPSQGGAAEDFCVAGKAQCPDPLECLHLLSGKQNADRFHLHRIAPQNISGKKIVAGLLRSIHSIGKMATEKKGITVRFEMSEMEELDALSDRYRVSSATIIRWALRALANHVERNDGRLVLPLELGDEAAVKAKKAPPAKVAEPARPLSRASRPPKKRGN